MQCRLQILQHCQKKCTFTHGQRQNSIAMLMSGNFEVLWFDQRCQGDREGSQSLRWSHPSFHINGPSRETPGIKEALRLVHWKFKGLAVPSDYLEMRWEVQGQGEKKRSLRNWGVTELSMDFVVHVLTPHTQTHAGMQSQLCTLQFWTSQVV